jgi:hypothetical protein
MLLFQCRQAGFTLPFKRPTGNGGVNPALRTDTENCALMALFLAGYLQITASVLLNSPEFKACHRATLVA